MTMMRRFQGMYYSSSGYLAKFVYRETLSVVEGILNISTGTRQRVHVNEMRYRNFSLGSAKQQEPIETRRARLLYRSRKRGILENDLLFGVFATYHLPKMSEHELREYEILLEEENEWELFNWIIGARPPPLHIESLKVFKTMKQFIKDHHLTKDTNRIAHIFSRQPNLYSVDDETTTNQIR